MAGVRKFEKRKFLFPQQIHGDVDHVVRGDEIVDRSEQLDDIEFGRRILPHQRQPLQPGLRHEGVAGSSLEQDAVPCRREFQDEAGGTPHDRIDGA
jgi:hypothetical protein